MKKLFLTLIISLCLSSVLSQKKLNTDKVIGIPSFNANGIIGDYTRMDLLQFINYTGWQSHYAKDKRFVPYMIMKSSDPFMRQFNIEGLAEAKKLLLDNNELNSYYEFINTTYGNLTIEDFKKYCVLLIILYKMDSSSK